MLFDQLAILETCLKSWTRVYDKETLARVRKELQPRSSSFQVQTPTELLH